MELVKTPCCLGQLVYVTHVPCTASDHLMVPRGQLSNCRLTVAILSQWKVEHIVRMKVWDNSWHTIALKVKVNVNLYISSSWTHLKGAQVWHVFSRDLTVLPATPSSSANGINHTCIFVPSRSWSSFTDPGGKEGWVGLSLCHTIITFDLFTAFHECFHHYCSQPCDCARLLTRRAECIREHLSTLDSHDVRCVSHFSRCHGSRRRWRRGLRVPRRVLRLLTDTVSGRLRSTRRVVVISATWDWRRRLTTTTTTVVYTTHDHITTLYTTAPSLLLAYKK